MYPSRSVYYQIIDRLIHYYENNVNRISVIIEIMKDEGEDQEIIENIELLHKEPTIKTQAEVTRLCIVLSDYVKYARILTLQNSFIEALDLVESDDTPVKKIAETMYNVSTKIIEAYNTVNISQVSHTFDTSDKEGMKTVVAEAKDTRSANNVIITGIRGLNTLLSPGYMSEGLYVYEGLPGNYKSGILLESHVGTCLYNEHIKQGLNGKTPISIYISMENTMAQTVRRLWSILFPTADMSTFTVDDIVDMINEKLSSNGFRSVILYYGYREKSTADIANIIRSYNTETTQVVALYFDYIKRVRPARTDPAAVSSEKGELNAIMNEFKTNICATFGIPVVTGHQLNRMAAAAVDDVVAHGGYNKSAQVLGRSQTGSAWEVMEVADWVGILNIENNGETKSLMVKAVKRREISNENEVDTFTAIRHPFINMQSFALKPDIMENVPLSTPIYIGKQTTNYMANI